MGRLGQIVRDEWCSNLSQNKNVKRFFTKTPDLLLQGVVKCPSGGPKTSNDKKVGKQT